MRPERLPKPKSATVLIFDRYPYPTKVLGVSRKNDPNDWGLPGGKLAENETPLGAAVRELREETGVRVRSSNLTEIYRGPCINTAGEPRYSVTYLAHKWSGKPHALEAGKVDWVTWQQLFEGSFSEYMRALYGTLMQPGRWQLISFLIPQ
jgi:ADP-ribose pyrophosphatase YjhB (NUDIX family)